MTDDMPKSRTEAATTEEPWNVRGRIILYIDPRLPDDTTSTWSDQWDTFIWLVIAGAILLGILTGIIARILMGSL